MATLDTTRQSKPSRRDFHKLGVASVGAYLAHRSGLLGGSVFESVQAATHAPQSEEWVSSACWVGKQDCGILARRVNGRVVKIEGHPGHPRNRGTLCPKGVAQVYDIYDPSRVRPPVSGLRLTSMISTAIRARIRPVETLLI